MKEAYCSYEVNELLKKKGFTASMPTHQLAMAWLREKGYHIVICTKYIQNDKGGGVCVYFPFYVNLGNGNLVNPVERTEYFDYNECVDTSLKYALENLIKKEDKK